MVDRNEIIRQLSIPSRESGQFNKWLERIEADVRLANSLGKELLFSAESICPQVDSHAFTELVSSIRRSVGLGKGVMNATLCYMPETLSRSLLKQWMVEDSEWKIAEADWEGMMLHSFQNGRLHLAQDMIFATKARYGESPIVSVLGCLDERELEASVSLWSDYRDVLVASFCARQSWSGAMKLADGREDLEGIVLSSICSAIDYRQKKRSWASVLKFMIDRSDGQMGINGTLDRFKSAGKVALEEVLRTPEDKRPEAFDTEDLKLMAFQLGLDDLVHSMSRETKRDALAFSLGI